MTYAKTKPAWAGEDMLSRLVNLLIHTRPLYALMKRQARQVLIKTAEKNGIPWQKTVAELSQAGLQERFAEIANPAVTYPDYYRVPFHAYDEGNLCWAAAYEAEPATHAMALRVWPQEDLTWEAAQDRLRSSFHNIVGDRIKRPVHDVLDVGCSVGISTVTLHHFFQATQDAPVRTVGLDLSPYMLTVASFRDRQSDIAEWVHGNAEHMPFATASFDVVTLQMVIHELPRQATQAIFREIWRVLRPGGWIAIVDNNPKSAVIQNLPPVLFTLMKSTEPWTDDYYTFEVEEALEQAGFEAVETRESDPRHRTLSAMKPLDE